MSVPTSQLEDQGDQDRGAHDLGRDDPLWPRYVQDAEKWDNDMMNNWNSRMDVLLLFATLFSAIITAFLIESSKNLRSDSSQITVALLMDISRILRTIANESQIITQDQQDSLPKLIDSKPSSTNILVNTLWFLSLCLSIIVALITSLVKQWCNSYVSDRIAPPCNQARIRQARFNKLNSWKAIWIVSMLPVLMHVALALFLTGLIFFLKDLNSHIWKAALCVTVLAAILYLLMTFAPFYIPFCPYRTPLSSPELWGYFIQWLPAMAIYTYGYLFETKLRPDFTNRMSWCQQQQHEISNNTIPDEVTGDALNWIILHTPESKTREMAIRSISSVKSEKTLKQLVVDPPGILPQVIQSFTSCFSLHSSTEGDNRATVAMNTTLITLHAQALLVLVNRIMHSLNSSDPVPVTISTWGVDEETVVAVEKRLQWLANNDQPSSACIVGLTGLSAWRRFVNYTYKSFDDCGELLVELTKHLNWQLPPDSCSDVLHAILVESAHWTPKCQANQKTELLCSLTDLILTSDQSIPDRFRAKLICSLAALMLGLNQGQTRLRLPPSPDQPDIETCTPSNYAQSVVDYYVQDPAKILGDEPLLLLLALTGLIEYYEHRIFDKSPHDNIAKIVPLLSALDLSGAFQSVVPPNDIWSNIHLREYFVEVLASYFQHSPVNSPTVDDATVPLLQVLSKHTVLWKDPASLHVLRAPILHVFARTNDTGLRIVCLKTIASNLEHTHSLSYMNMLFASKIPYELVKLMGAQMITPIKTPMAHRSTAMVFTFLSEDAGPPQALAVQPAAEHDRSLEFVTQILLDGLLEAFVRHLLSSATHEFNAYGKRWWGKIEQAINNRLGNCNTRDEKLQGTYNYLKHRKHLMIKANELQTISLGPAIDQLLALMDQKNKELWKDYVRSIMPKTWLKRIEDRKTFSLGDGPSTGPGTTQHNN